MSDTIHFYGNAVDGYTAEQRGNQCTVSKVAGGWSTQFYGSPSKRNPIIVDSAAGTRSQSCMCPLVDVDGVFKNRRLAAEAGLAAYKADRS